jgi:cell division protein ZapA
MEDAQTTRVEIFGTEYSVRADAGAEEQYVRDIAAYVDAKMKEISESQKLVSSTKIAILAAINLADEIFQGKNRNEKADQHVSAKVLELSEVLAREL